MQNKLKINVVVTYLPLSKEIDDMTLKCLNLISKNTHNDYDLSIVSNGVVNEYLLKNLVHDCEILEFADNTGNASAWDRGMRNSQNDIVILMDNDVFVKKDWDRQMISTISDKSIGVAFPYSVLGTNDYRARQYRARRDGFCFALRKDVYAKAGPFLKDQPFHSYYEDDAFFAEVQFNLGLRLVACQNSKVMHKGQGTTKKILDKVIEDGIKANKEWFEKKYNNNYPYLEK